MIDVFLSASVPLPTRDRRFFDTADVLAIREAVKGLVEVVLPEGHITFGGHPAITPLVALFVQEAGYQSDHVTLFQSALWSGSMPSEIATFLDVQITPAVGDDRDASLRLMRETMIASRQFTAAVVIGGMEGVFEELDIFRESHPNALVLPIASTGAAAAIIYKNGNYDPTLAQDRTFPSLFRRHLSAP